MKLAPFDVKRLVSLVRAFKGTRLLVLGDMMLDQFVWGSVRRISPEAPVPVVEVKKETRHLGGAANVAHNLWTLGGAPQVIGVIGDDYMGQLLDQELKRVHARPGLVVDPTRMTTVKTRIVAHNQQVCRTDRENATPLNEPARAAVIAAFDRWVKTADGIIVSDYAKGVIDGVLMRHVSTVAERRGLFFCVDPKVKNFSLYHQATILTPNQLEAETVADLAIEDEASLRTVGERIFAATSCRHLLITRGEAGMSLFQARDHVMHIPAVAREVFDVTGAGDTVISTLAMALARGASLEEAALLSNFAASIVVGKVGTASVTAEELIATVRDHGAALKPRVRRPH